jgi:hypothetical protein
MPQMQVSTVDASGAELPAGAVDVRGVQNYLPPHPLVSAISTVASMPLLCCLLSCCLNS